MNINPPNDSFDVTAFYKVYFLKVDVKDNERNYCRKSCSLSTRYSFFIMIFILYIRKENTYQQIQILNIYRVQINATVNGGIRGFVVEINILIIYY